MPSQSNEMDKLVVNNFESLYNQHGTQSSSGIAQVTGQIGKIVRQGPKVTIDAKNGTQSTQNYCGEFENSLKAGADQQLPGAATN